MENNSNPMNGGSQLEVTPKKKSNVKIIAIVAVIVVALFGGVALAANASGMFKSDKAVVWDAFAGFMEPKEKGTYETVFGYEDLFKLMNTGSTEYGMNLKIEDIADESTAFLKGGELSMDFATDMENRKVFAGIIAKYSGLEVANLEIFMDSTKIQAAVPTYTDKAFTIDYSKDIKEQITNSPVLSSLVEETPEGIDAINSYFDTVKKTMSKDTKIVDYSEIIERFKTTTKALDNLKESMVVEKTDSKEFEVNGKKEDCKGYNVTISGEAMVNFVDTTGNFLMEDSLIQEVYWSMVEGYYSSMSATMGESFDMKKELKDLLEEAKTEMKESLDSVEMVVYVNKNGDLADLKADMKFKDETTKVTYEQTFMGGNTNCENTKGVVTIVIDGEEVKVSFDKKGSFDADVLKTDLDVKVTAAGQNQMNFKYVEDYNTKSEEYNFNLNFAVDADSFDIIGKGKITDVVKGKSFTANVDSMMVKYNNTDVVELSGSFYVKPLSKEVTELTGTQMDVFAATQEEWMAVYYEIMASAAPILNELGIPLY